MTTYAGPDPNDPSRFIGLGGNQAGGRMSRSSYPRRDFEFRTGTPRDAPPLRGAPVQHTEGSRTPIPQAEHPASAGVNLMRSQLEELRKPVNVDVNVRPIRTRMQRLGRQAEQRSQQDFQRNAALSSYQGYMG